MLEWICPNCETNNTGIKLCDVCDKENSKYPLVKFNSFSISKKVFFEDEKVYVIWDIENYSNVKLVVNEKKFPISKTSKHSFDLNLDLKFKETILVKLVIYDLAGDEFLTETRKITVLTKPKISSITLNKNKIKAGENIRINWIVTKYSTITLVINETTKIDITDKRDYEFIPKANTIVFIEAKGVDDETIIQSKRKYIKVFKPIEVSFTANKKWTVESLPINLTWKTTNAKTIHIRSAKDSYKYLSTKGNLEVYPSNNSIYKIIAKNEVESKEAILNINVLELPKIENMILPELPQFNALIELPFGLIEGKKNQLKSQNRKKSKLYKIFTALNKCISTRINSNKLLEIINKRIND